MMSIIKNSCEKHLGGSQNRLFFSRRTISDRAPRDDTVPIKSHKRVWTTRWETAGWFILANFPWCWLMGTMYKHWWSLIPTIMFIQENRSIWKNRNSSLIGYYISNGVSFCKMTVSFFLYSSKSSEDVILGFWRHFDVFQHLLTCYRPGLGSGIQWSHFLKGVPPKSEG